MKLRSNQLESLKVLRDLPPESLRAFRERIDLADPTPTSFEDLIIISEETFGDHAIASKLITTLAFLIHTSHRTAQTTGAVLNHLVESLTRMADWDENEARLWRETEPLLRALVSDSRVIAMYRFSVQPDSPIARAPASGESNFPGPLIDDEHSFDAFDYLYHGLQGLRAGTIPFLSHRAALSQNIIMHGLGSFLPRSDSAGGAEPTASGSVRPTTGGEILRREIARSTTTGEAPIPLETYLRTIENESPLSAVDESSLAEAVASGDVDARRRLIQASLRLVAKIALDYVGRGITLEDLIGEGNLGLLRATHEFQPQYGTRFSTYASYWIRQSIRRALIHTAPTPNSNPRGSRAPVRAVVGTQWASSGSHDQTEPPVLPVPDAPEKILERFDGFVEKVEDDTAYVTMRTSRGETLHGSYPAGELKAAGVGERSRFVLTTLDLGRDVRIEISPIPPVELTAERQREIEDETERLFEGFDPVDDY
jgi:RNA polymerase sigma factor (sigma-70 family)